MILIFFFSVCSQAALQPAVLLPGPRRCAGISQTGYATGQRSSGKDVAHAHVHTRHLLAWCSLEVILDGKSVRASANTGTGVHFISRQFGFTVIPNSLTQHSFLFCSEGRLVFFCFVFFDVVHLPKNSSLNFQPFHLLRCS